MNYFRFKGFWFESEYKPFHSYQRYQFLDKKYYGLHNSFIHFNGDKQDIINKIDTLSIDRDTFLSYFREELSHLKRIDDNSDIKMYDYFINNYKNTHLFHDVFHPTNLFFYQMFRQLVFKLTNYELPMEDLAFVQLCNDIEMTHWALPILPCIKQILEIDTPNVVSVFYPPKYADKKLDLSIYDYYYIRLSEKNFETYLNKLTY
jgi:hypothetical protein